MANARVARGRRSNTVAAEYFKPEWPEATPTFGSEPGRDIKGMLGLAPEVKARRDFAPTTWLLQAEKNADGDLAFVIVRPDGAGEKTVGNWLVCLRLAEFKALLLEAGYGSGSQSD